MVFRVYLDGVGFGGVWMGGCFLLGGLVGVEYFCWWVLNIMLYSGLFVRIFIPPNNSNP